MIRVPFHVVFLLTTVALIAATVRSLQISKPVCYYREPSEDSSFCVVVDRFSVRLWEWTFSDSARTASKVEGALAGFGVLFERKRTGTGRNLLTHRLTVPGPFLMVVLLSFPVLGFIRGPLRRRRRRRLGQCLQCAYALTGNTSGVCPECGTNLDGIGAKAMPATAESKADGNTDSGN